MRWGTPKLDCDYGFRGLSRRERCLDKPRKPCLGFVSGCREGAGCLGASVPACLAAWLPRCLGACVRGRVGAWLVVIHLAEVRRLARGACQLAGGEEFGMHPPVGALPA